MIAQHKSDRRALVFAVHLITLGAVPVVAAASEVHVQMLDQSTGDDVNMFMMRAEPATVPSGPVKFLVQNNSKDTIHEMLVIPVASAKTVLPGIKKASGKVDKDKLDEDQLHSVGEVSDLKAGEKGSVELNLKPGIYRLLCNQRTHYRSGMTTLLTVSQ